MAKFTDSPILTDRYTKAVNLVLQLHSNQIRKGHVECPYITHLLTVSSLVLEGGGTEDEAIAALLHDSIEDVDYSLDSIKQQFGDNVAQIVDDLSEDKNHPSPKDNYIKRMQTANLSVIRVSLADKLHNARCYVINSHLINKKVVDFFVKLYKVYSTRKNLMLCSQIKELDELDHLISEMEKLIRKRG